MVGEAITNALLEEEVKSIGWFGVRNSWLESAEWGGARYEESNPLLFDKEGNKKPFYYGILRAFVD
jgi:GH35 family endo-1,4-beta-xylanase